MNKKEKLKQIKVKKGYSSISKSINELKENDTRAPISYRMKSAVKVLLINEAKKKGTSYQTLLTDILDQWYLEKRSDIKGNKKEPVISISELEEFLKLKRQT